MKTKYEHLKETYYLRADADIRMHTLIRQGWLKVELRCGYDENDRELYHVYATKRKEVK